MESSEPGIGEYVQEMYSKIVAMGLTGKAKTDLIAIILNFLKFFKETNRKWIEDGATDAMKVLNLTYDLTYCSFTSVQKMYKGKTGLALNKNYVKPIEKSIGTRTELKKVKFHDRIMSIPRLIQCVIYYVPILETLKSVLSDPEFESLYFEYNQTLNTNVIGKDGSKKYSNFSSGSNFANSPLFRSEPNSLQLQVSQDDFDPCNNLQSKAGRHKVCALYFRIHNMPPKYASKLNNIFLICLCNSDDLKTKQTDLNNIWHLIKDEILKLETDGIIVNRKPLRGTLVQTAFDNLGANVALGFSGSFSANKYCKHCVMSKSECQEFTTESACTMRTIKSYERSLEIIADSESVNLNDTDGVKFYCVLSDLHYYHILTHPTADIMHDICEGCIPALLRRFFKFCFEKKKFQILNLIIW